jgi:alcohol dehydrogenase (cytochrome c)
MVIGAVVLCGAAMRAQEERRDFVPVTDAMLQQPNPADWLMWRRTLDAWGYSPLDQINRGNVARLRVAWTRDMAPGRNEPTPLVYNGIMYLPNPSDVIQALDARSGTPIWEYRRELPKDLRRSNESNRNITIYGTTIIDTSSDNQVYALDARTGALVWQTPVYDHTKRATATAGPIIANGKIIGGRNCQPDASPDGCIITAHDAKTGKELWRTHTIPKPGEPGGDTWGSIPYEGRWHIGTWMPPSYDPELNLVYFGTSVTIPAPKFALGGNDNQHLYHNSTLALDANTGKIVWHYQHLIDHWDLDHPFERLLVETAVSPDASEVPWINPRVKPGERRKVITGIPGKTGLVYTLDRRTGEFLWARPTVMQNVVSRIDGTTGKATVNPQALFTAIGQERFICPSTNGGKNWPAGAYSPQTSAMYMPLQNTCMTITSTTDKPDPAKVYGFSGPGTIAPGTENIGSIWAISAESGKTLWKHEQRAGMLSLITTAGGLVIAGDASGHLLALDDRTGKVLWDYNVGAPLNGFPVTFAVAGKQYLAVATGASNVSTATLRMAPELKPGTGNRIVVFALE